MKRITRYAIVRWALMEKRQNKTVEFDDYFRDSEHFCNGSTALAIYDTRREAIRMCEEGYKIVPVQISWKI